MQPVGCQKYEGTDAVVLGYRSYFTVGGDRDVVVDRAMEQVSAWLEHKGRRAWQNYRPQGLVEGRSVPLADGVEGQLVRIEGQDGSSSFRVRTVERQGAGGTWTQQVTVHVPGSRERMPWVWIDVDSPDGRWTATPRLATNLLEVLDARDGHTALAPSVVRVRASDAPALVDSVLDVDRRNVMFVAGSAEGIPFEQWVKHVAKLTTETSGLAGTYVLDGSATRILNARLGERFGVHPWTMRTYFPEVDLENVLDSLRHRILSTERISSESDSRIARMLGWRVREHIKQTSVPNAARRIDRALEARLDELLIERITIPIPDSAESHEKERPAIEPAAVEAADVIPPNAEVADESLAAVIDPSPVVDAAEMTAFLSASIAELLGTNDVDLRNLREFTKLARIGRQAEAAQHAVQVRFVEVQSSVDILSAERDELRKRLEDEQLERAAEADERVRSEGRVEALRQLLARTDQAAAAWVTEPEESALVRPESFEDLMESFEKFPGIQFTGDEDIALELDVHDPIGNWARTTWEILAAVADYARAKADGSWDRDVDGYLRSTPEGYRGFSAGRHARDETKTLKANRNYSAPRTLPVPTTVDPSGRTFMGAHFKIAQSGMISPRLHYLDDTARSGRVYIGYIGPHLPSDKTN